MASHRPPLSPCQKLGLPSNEELKHDLGETPKFIKKHLGTPGGTAERENPHISAAFPVFEDVTHRENLIPALAMPGTNLGFTPCWHWSPALMANVTNTLCTMRSLGLNETSLTQTRSSCWCG